MYKRQATYSGTPQGGIVSPILANIYLNELDRHVEELQKVFEAPSKVYLTHEYTLAASRLGKLRAKINRAQGEERDRLIAKHRELRKALLKIPAKSHTDKRICYVRYADDFLIGVCGNKQECEQIKACLLYTSPLNSAHNELSDLEGKAHISETKVLFSGML